MPDRRNSPQIRIDISQYLTNSLIDNNGNVLSSLISDEGGGNAKEFSNFLDSTRDSRSDVAIRSSQLRKFYDNFLKIYFSEADDDNKRVQLLLMKAQINYANARLKIKSFAQIMSHKIQLVVSASPEKFQNNLDAFKLHFEAVVGYFPKK